MRVVLTVFVLSFLGTVAAADAFVRCVQNYLSDLSVEVGEIDGLFGRQTEGAVAQLIEENDHFSEHPPLSNENASFWCRELGLYREDQSHWSSVTDPISIVVQPTISEGKGRLIDRTVASAYRFLTANLEVEVPGTITIVFSTDMSFLAAETHKVLSDTDSLGSIRAQLDRQCNNRSFVSAASYGSVIAVCPNPNLGPSGNWSEDDVQWLQRTVAHELSHEFATQLTGNYRKLGDEIRDTTRGPNWLFEGSAIALELEFGVPDVSISSQKAWFAEQQTYDGERLRVLSRFSTVQEPDFQLNAGLAGVNLAVAHGFSSFGRYWERTPFIGWEASFGESFGQEVDAFYDRFGADQ